MNTLPLVLVTVFQDLCLALMMPEIIIMCLFSPIRLANIPSSFSQLVCGPMYIPTKQVLWPNFSFTAYISSFLSSDTRAVFYCNNEVTPCFKITTVTALDDVPFLFTGRISSTLEPGQILDMIGYASTLVSIKIVTCRLCVFNK